MDLFQKKAILEVSEDERNVAKQVCYGILYGLGASSLAIKLKMPLTSAENFINKFKASFPKVQQLIEGKKKSAIESLNANTMMGRRRFFEKPQNALEKSELEREAFSAVIQGSAADLMKKAMLNVWQELKRLKKKTKLLLQIHDELLFEVPQEELTFVKTIIKNQMEKAITLCVPIPVKIKVGQTWGTLTG